METEKNIVNEVPINEEAVQALETELTQVLLKHRADDGITLRDATGTIMYLLFVITSAQQNPKESIDEIKEGLDKMCQTWYEGGRPNVMAQLIARTLSVTVPK